MCNHPCLEINTKLFVCRELLFVFFNRHVESVKSTSLSVNCKSGGVERALKVVNNVDTHKSG